MKECIQIVFGLFVFVCIFICFGIMVKQCGEALNKKALERQTTVECKCDCTKESQRKE